jgi:hypothetical protein
MYIKQYSMIKTQTYSLNKLILTNKVLEVISINFGKMYFLI